MEVHRGEVFYADLSPVVGSEQGGVRPVLIVQNEIGNRHSPTVIAPPLHPGWTKPGFPPTSTSGRRYGPCQGQRRVCWSRSARWINTACGSGPVRSLPRTSAGWTRRWM